MLIKKLLNMFKKKTKENLWTDSCLTCKHFTKISSYCNEHEQEILFPERVLCPSHEKS